MCPIWMFGVWMYCYFVKLVKFCAHHLWTCHSKYSSTKSSYIISILELEWGNWRTMDSYFVKVAKDALSCSYPPGEKQWKIFQEKGILSSTICNRQLGWCIPLHNKVRHDETNIQKYHSKSKRNVPYALVQHFHCQN